MDGFIRVTIKFLRINDFSSYSTPPEALLRPGVLRGLKTPGYRCQRSLAIGDGKQSSFDVSTKPE